MILLTETKDLSRLSRQDRILMTALRLFTELGYFNTSIHDIQRVASIGIGSIYHYFKNKEGIAQALFNGLVAAMDEGMERINISHTTAHARCREALAWLMDLTRSSPSVMQFIIE